MSATPTTRASRSRYSSPAVVVRGGLGGSGGVGAAYSRNSTGGSRDRGRDKDKDRGENNAGSGGGGGGTDAPSSRSSSTERSRRFMESWIEPERARMPSFQEDGLLRQGVLETMEPLGTRPKPAMIKKLAVMGREGSPTASSRGGKPGGRKIVLKRKNGNSIGIDSAPGGGGNGSAMAASDVLPSGVQSTSPSTAMATPQPVVSPTPTPGPAALPGQSPLPPQSLAAPSPTPTPKIERPDTPTIQPLLSEAVSDQPELLKPDQRGRCFGSTPEPRVISQSQLNSRNSQSLQQQQLLLQLPSPNPLLLPPVASFSSSSNSFLPDPIKPSIEELPSLAHLPTTPRSVQSTASTYDSDDYFKRESSIQSTSQLSMPSKRAAGIAAAKRLRSASVIPDAEEDQAATGPSGRPAKEGSPSAQEAQPQLGLHCSEAELTRIMQEDERLVVRTIVEHGVAEALKHHQYVEAYALRLAYNHNQRNARFLLQTEAMAKQLITREAAGEWALKLQPYKDEGAKDHTALRYFRPEAETDSSIIEAYRPQQAPYAHLLSIDLSEVRNPKRKRNQQPDWVEDDHVTEKKRKKQSAGQGAKQEEEEGSSTLLQEHVDQGESLATRGEPDEAEAERVATPPRKRQKTQRESTARKAATTTRTARPTTTNGARSAAPSQRRRTRAGSSASNASSALTSIASDIEEEAAGGEATEEAAQPVEPPADKKTLSSPKQAQQKKKKNKTGNAQMQMQGGGDGAAADVRHVKGVNNAAAPAVRPITDEGPRRLPARRARGTVNPEGYYPRDPFSNSHNPPHPTTTSQPPNNRNINTTSTSSQPGPVATQPDRNNLSATTAIATATNDTAAAAQQIKQQPTKKSRRGMPDFTPQYRLEEGDATDKLRAHARANTHKLTASVRSTSFARGEEVSAPSPPERPGSAASSALSSVPDAEVLEETERELETEPETHSAAPKSRAAPSGGGAARATRASKRTIDDLEDDATPFSQDFGAAEPGLGTGTGSRAETPRPAKRQKGTRRVKQSPMKNKAWPSTGLAPSQGGKRASPGVNGVVNNQEENDDFCSFCGGNGNLVCCDGCNKSFHYMCHTPTVDPDEDAAWYCWDCMVKRDPGLVGEYNGPFGSLMANLDKKHSKAFILPKKIRDHFEGVRTGPDGEYEEFVPPTKAKKKEKNEDKDFDFYQIVDKNEKPILCHSCSKSAASDRVIIPCSICGLWWHPECLDPPKTLPPHTRTFVCPCHVDDLLSQVPCQLGPAHKHRKIKGSSEITYAYRRGNVNNGWIEVDDDGGETDGTSLIVNTGGLRDPASWGRTHRVRFTGIRDDFISKVGRRRHSRKSHPLPLAQLPDVDYEEDAEDRYQAALTMMAFARKAREERGGRPVNFSSESLGVVKDQSSLWIPPQNIEGATASELTNMERELVKMVRVVRKERSKRSGDHQKQSRRRSTGRQTPHPGHSRNGRGVSALTANPQQQEEQQQDEEAGVGDDPESPIVIDDNDSVYASEHDDLGLAIGSDAAEPIDELDQAAALEAAAGASTNKSAGNNTEAAALEPPQITPSELSQHEVEFPPANADKETESDIEAIATSMVESIVDQAVAAARTPISDTLRDGGSVSE